MLKVTLILALTFVCVQPIFAQATSPEHREWEVSGFAGGSFLGDSEFLTLVFGTDQETARTVGLHYGSGYQFGVRVRNYLSNYWAADLEYSFANQPLTFTNLSPDLPSLSVSESVQHLSYNVSYIPLKPTSRFRPYASAGAGAALFFIPSGSKNEALAQGVRLRDSWKFAFNWGGGLRYLLADRWALAFDVKDQITGVPSYGLSHSAAVIQGRFRPGIARSGFLNNWQLNLGIAFQWDDE
jgi:opacity protein-like surface antigen